MPSVSTTPAGAARPRLVLIHGAATTSQVWRYVVAHLDRSSMPGPADQVSEPGGFDIPGPDRPGPGGQVTGLGGFDVRCPDRPCTGDLAAEVAALTADCDGALVAGVSGGATLGLALAAAGVPMAAAILHEPAVGSLLPGLLDPVRAAFRAGGTAAFAEALYGPAWTPEEAPADAGAVARDLAMFSAFEPAAPAPAAGPVVITVGECSPQARHESARRLADRFGLPVWTVPGARHAVHLEHPAEFAAAIRRLASTYPDLAGAERGA